jgi:hypothetical protein
MTPAAPTANGTYTCHSGDQDLPHLAKPRVHRTRMEEVPLLIELHKKYAKEAVIIGVSVETNVPRVDSATAAD